MQKQTKGLIGVLGIWLGNGIALPLIALHRVDFSTEQMMMTRGIVTALVAIIALKGAIRWPNRHITSFSVVFSFACLSLYKGVREWGPGPTIIILTLTPLVNFVFSWWHGRALTRAMWISCAAMVGGVAFALEPWLWTATTSWKGVVWSVIATLLSGIGFEELKKSESISRWQRTFWIAMAMAIVGTVSGLLQNSVLTVAVSPQLLLSLTTFALLAGPIYIFSNTVAFDNLRVETASILAQGETLAVILLSGLILHQEITVAAIIGSCIALVGVAYLSRNAE